MELLIVSPEFAPGIRPDNQKGRGPGGEYYYRADGRRSDILGKSGAHDFAGSYSHTWVFFLEDQSTQMRAKYPDMDFR